MGAVMAIKEVLEYLRINGWCVIPDVIPQDHVAVIRRSVEETTYAKGIKTGTDGVATRKGLLAFNQSFVPYLADERILGIAEALFGPHVRISFTTAHINLPGNARGGWHADWPFNQNNAGHIPAPYPDVVMHLTTIWMLSPFTTETGATLIVPGSHRANNNPTGNNGVNPNEPYPTEMQVAGNTGSVLVFDSRMWHAAAVNHSNKPRVGLVVRYAPWWLNLDVLRPGSVERRRMADETGMRENEVVPVPLHIYEALPSDVKPLFRHWVEH
jgi:hypothetical protein